MFVHSDVFPTPTFGTPAFGTLAFVHSGVWGRTTNSFPYFYFMFKCVSITEGVVKFYQVFKNLITCAGWVFSFKINQFFLEAKPIVLFFIRFD